MQKLAAGRFLSVDLSGLGRRDDVICFIDVVKAVLVIRHAGQPPLPSHLLRE